MDGVTSNRRKEWSYRRGSEDGDLSGLQNGNMMGAHSTRTRNDGLLTAVCKLLVCSSAGVIFGIACEKGRVFEPSIIREQMLFTKFVLLKMFLSAVTSSLLCLALMSMLPFTYKKFVQARREFAKTLKTKSALSSVVGGGILGAGMTLCGSCPGMVLSQVGAGVNNAVVVLFGCFAGAALYGLMEPWVTRMTKPAEPHKIYALDQGMPTPFFFLALPLASTLAVVIFCVEHFVPWTTDLTAPNAPADSWFTMRSWPPILSGIIVGCLQVPVVLSVEDTIGASGSYCTAVSQVLVTSHLQRLSSYLSRHRKGLENWWQVFYVTGAVLGAWISSTSSETFGSVHGVSTNTAFLGGILIIFGARLAAGCTSGHGVSGMGTLSLLSFIVVPATFTGGIATAFTLKSLAVI
ncbi:thiosulfate transporter TsuA-like [Ptychodera flava]|uniref:thiosulfate transporter TsuA-like n=1 Tax=Ptychodera flava TaxID=63121 RepID=UPI003969EC05